MITSSFDVEKVDDGDDDADDNDVDDDWDWGDDIGGETFDKSGLGTSLKAETCK